MERRRDETVSESERLEATRGTACDITAGVSWSMSISSHGINSVCSRPGLQSHTWS